MEEREKALRRFTEWERYALEDEQIIQLALREDGPPNQICLHAQQMAEKYLKGYLAFQGVFPMKTHHLGQLLDACIAYDPDFVDLKEEAILLNAFYVEARYPGDIIDFTLKNAQAGYDAAKKVRELVAAKIGRAQSS